MDRETEIQLYLLGYEDGQKEAWAEIKRLIKKYDGWDLKSRIQSKLGTLYQDIDFKRAELMDDPTILDIEEEEVVEEPPRREPEGEWKHGDSYIVLEPKPYRATDAIKSLMDDNGSIFISNDFPKTLIETYDVPGENIFFLQLTSSGYGKFNNTDIKYTKTSPSNLSSLSSKVGDFLKKNPGAIVLMHGLQDLILHNQFSRTLSFVKWLTDNVREIDGTLILSVDDSTYDKTELAKLQTYFDHVIKG